MNTVIDKNLYPLLLEISPNFDEAVWLQDHIRINHEERDQFLNNEIENPHFTYRSQLPRINYSERIELLEKVLEESKIDTLVIDLYRKKIDKQKQRNALVAASLCGDDELFFKTSCDLYGKPKKKYFSYVAKRVLSLCEKTKSKFPSNAKRLHRILSKIATNELDIDETVLPPVVTEGKLIQSTDEIISVFQDTLNRCGIDGWSIHVDHKSEKSRFSVSPLSQTIFIPTEKQLEARLRPLTDTHIKALAEHEIGVHVRRSHEAKKGRLRLLESGLDSYLPGEEGLAGYAQQQIEGADEFYGFDRYLAASLAVGMDGKARDFRAVFNIMLDFYTLKLGNEEKNTAPFRVAWDVCVRIFRGTSGQSVGNIFTKDIVYMEGNIGIWNLLSEKPQVFESLFVGKFNPLLKRHVNTLQTLEILKEW